MTRNRKRRLKRTSTIRTGILATKERSRQQGGVREEAIDRAAGGGILMKRHRANAECVLDAYFLRGYLTSAQFEAGMKFRHAYLRAVLRVRIEDGSGSHGDIEMAALIVPISEQLLQKAYAALSTAQKTIVIKVCGHDEWAGDKDRIKTMQRGLVKLAALWNLA